MKDLYNKNRRSIRLKGYDYSQPGYYFITICTKNRECVFGEIFQQHMRLSALGKIVDYEWRHISNRYSNVILNEFIVMPNHIHGIIIISDEFFVGISEEIVGTTFAVAQCNSIVQNNNMTGARSISSLILNERAGARPAPTITIGNIVGSFKSLCVHGYLQYLKNKNIHDVPGKFWQRNYYESIIENDSHLENVQAYIQNNPLNWNTDPENLEFIL
ncbi:transposase [Candidatus Peregrinibacteria bacterium]|nr:transposase [Candidatus Peregrinibacteria bacterium]